MRRALPQQNAPVGGRKRRERGRTGGKGVDNRRGKKNWFHGSGRKRYRPHPAKQSSQVKKGTYATKSVRSLRNPKKKKTWGGGREMEVNKKKVCEENPQCETQAGFLPSPGWGKKRTQLEQGKKEAEGKGGQRGGGGPLRHSLGNNNEELPLTKPPRTDGARKRGRKLNRHQGRIPVPTGHSAKKTLYRGPNVSKRKKRAREPGEKKEVTNLV